MSKHRNDGYDELRIEVAQIKRNRKAAKKRENVATGRFFDYALRARAERLVDIGLYHLVNNPSLEIEL